MKLVLRIVFFSSVLLWSLPATAQQAVSAMMNRRDVRFYRWSIQLPLGSDTAKHNQPKMERPDVDFSN